MTLQTRLIAGFGILMLLASVEGLGGLYYMKVLNGHVEKIYSNELLAIKNLGEIKSTLYLIRADALDHILTDNPRTKKSLLAKISSNRQIIEAGITNYKQIAQSAVARKLILTYETQFANYANHTINEVLPISHDSSNRDSALLAYRNSLAKYFVDTNDILSDLISFNKNSAQTRYQYAIADYQTITRLVIGIILTIILLSIVTAVIITRSINSRIKLAVKVTAKVSKGDLTGHIEMESNDEMGRLLGSLGMMTRSLTRIVNKVHLASDTITTATNEIAVGNTELSTRTNDQAASLEETAASMEELTSTVMQNAENAQTASTLSLRATENAQNGASAMNHVVAGMGAIHKSASEIAGNIQVIDELAFQTNILALNAAIEAARAGEHGRGFAVVASEVRQLAHRSTATAEQIKKLIAASVNEVKSGKEVVAQAQLTMDEIVSSVQQVNGLVADIANASREQSSSISQVNQAVVDMENNTQMNAALVEESAAAANSLHQQAAALNESIDVFKIAQTTELQSQQHLQETDSDNDANDTHSGIDQASSAQIIQSSKFIRRN